MAMVNKKPLKIVAAVLLGLAAAVFIIHTIILSQRSDGETVFWQGETAVIAGNQGEVHTLFLCYPDDGSPDTADAPQTLDVIASQSAGISVDFSTAPIEVMSVQMAPPRVIDLPQDLCDAHHLGSKPRCSVSESFITEGETLLLNTPENTFVIDAHDASLPSRSDLFLIGFFLLLIWNGIMLACKTGLFMPKSRCKPDPVHSIAAFFGAIVLTYLITRYLMPPPPPDREILPGYGELFVTLGGNFISFLGISVFFWWLWQKCNHSSAQMNAEAVADMPQAQSVSDNGDIVDSPAATPDSDGSPAEPDKANAAADSGLRKDSIALPFWSAIGLAVLAVLSVAFAPDPGIAMSELASQLTSTGYLTAYFALLAGVCEECLFRGVIQTSLMPGPNARHPMLQNVIAIGITTILFVFMHVPQSMDHLWALIPIAMVSILSGILRVRSGALYQSILLHITYNAVLLLPSILSSVLL